MDKIIKRKISALVIIGMFAAIALCTSVTADVDTGVWVSDDSGNDVTLSTGVSSYDVGIGDDDPDFKLEVAVSSGYGFFGVSTAAGDDGDIFKIDSSGNVGIGDQSLTYKLEVNGEAEFDGALRARDGTGIGFKDDAGNLGLWVQDGGNVGIGVSGPGEKLEIDGNVVLSATDDRIIYVGNSPSGGHNGYDLTVRAEHAVKFVSDVNGGSLKLVGGNGDGTSGNGGDVYIYGGIKGGVAGFDGNVILAHTSTNAHGKVGIGTAGPETELHVEGTITVDQKIMADDTGGLELATGEGTTRLFIQDGGYVGIGTTGPDRKLDILDASNPQLRLTYTDGSVYTDLQTTSNGYLYINPSGSNVGIGTANPRYQVHIHDSTAANLCIGSTGPEYYAVLRLYSDDTLDSEDGWTIYSEGISVDFKILSVTGGASPVTRFWIDDTNGNVGIGTATVPDRKLEIADASNPQIRLTQAEGSVYTELQTTSNGYLYINPSGSNVGIGISSPTSRLDINDDDIRIRTKQTPASSSADGYTGEICWDENAIYVCTNGDGPGGDTDTWERASISEW